jgi:hypothetical protein
MINTTADNMREFHNSLTTLDNLSPALIQYDSMSNSLSYHQLNNIVMTSRVSHYYVPKRFSIGVLTPDHLAELIAKLKSLIERRIFDSPYTTISVDKFKIKIYSSYRKGSYTSPPQLIEELDLVPYSGTLKTWIIMRFYSSESRVLYTTYKNLKKYGSKDKSDM